MTTKPATNHSDQEFSLNEVDIAIITNLIDNYMTAYELTKKIYSTNTIDETKKYLKRVKRRLERLVRYGVLEKKTVCNGKEVYMLKTSEYLCINGILLEPFMVKNIYGVKIIKCPFYSECREDYCKLLEILNSR